MNHLPAELRHSGAVEIKQRLETVSGGKVLDVGTQKGDFIGTLMKTLKDHVSFTGIDISKTDIEAARKEFEGKPVEFLEMNAEELAFNDSSFDTVCISHSLHHLDKIDKVLTEMKRVLKPGGHFIIQESFCDGEQSEAQQTEILKHHWGSEIDNLLGIPHNKTLTRDRLKDTINEIGLAEVELFESSWYVKCLFCDNAMECVNPKSESIIKYALKEIDDDLERIKGHPDHNKLNEKAEMIRKSLQETGTASASCFFAIGKK